MSPHRRSGGTCPAVTQGVSSSQLQVEVSAWFLSRDSHDLCEEEKRSFGRAMG